MIAFIFSDHERDPHRHRVIAI
ncbi:hypothetical protein IL54_1290 [Sphingobium sp. ba1]|nr:hypothetical protein IL54_1290 [Sphingobium sp. ba1]